MKGIDEMDMLGFLRLRAWDATREQEKKKPRQRCLDEVWLRREAISQNPPAIGLSAGGL